MHKGIIIAIIIVVVLLIIGGIVAAVLLSKDTTTPSTYVPPAGTTPTDTTTSPVVDPAAAAAAAASEKAINDALAETYGFNPAGQCPSGTCTYGIMRMTGGQCRAVGGAMNGTPGDSEVADCHVNFGKKAPRGFLPPGSCPSGTCYDVAFGMTGAGCRALGGRSDVSGDTESGFCHMSGGASPKYGLYPVGTCPTGTCYPASFQALGAQCRASGGTATGDGWTPCTFNIGPATR